MEKKIVCRTWARPGLSLIEVVLAVTIGLTLVGGSIFAYQQTRASSRVKEAQMVVGTVQTNIGMDKFRLGAAPPLAATPSPYPSSFGVALNVDSQGRPFHPQGTATSLPADPISGLDTVLPYDSTATPVPLVSNAPSPQWDNPVFLTAGPSPGYGHGGWLYDANTGAFRVNYSNQQYPAERPGAW